MSASIVMLACKLFHPFKYGANEPFITRRSLPNTLVISGTAVLGTMYTEGKVSNCSNLSLYTTKAKKWSFLGTTLFTTREEHPRTAFTSIEIPRPFG